jgi:hypothetical protein
LELKAEAVTSAVDSQILPRTKIGFLPLFGGILALSAEAEVMAALMVMAGICALAVFARPSEARRGERQVMADRK